MPPAFRVGGQWQVFENQLEEKINWKNGSKKKGKDMELLLHETGTVWLIAIIVAAVIFILLPR